MSIAENSSLQPGHPGPWIILRNVTETDFLFKAVDNARGSKLCYNSTVNRGGLQAVDTWSFSMLQVHNTT